MAAFTIVAGCKDRRTDQPSEPATTQGSAPIAGRVTGVRTSYDECRGKAQDNAQQLLACSDRAVDALLGLEPEASTVLARDFKSLGDALVTSSGGPAAESMRVFAADQVVRYGLARVSLPECAEANEAAACSTARSVLRQDFIREAIKSSPVGGAADGLGAPFGGYTPPTCSQVRGSASIDAALGQFDREFPMALKDEKLVEARQLDDTQLRPIVGYLACLAARTDFGPDVAETSLWLFSSKRNGTRARSALTLLAKQSGPDAKAAVEFAKQIDGYLALGNHVAE